MQHDNNKTYTLFIEHLEIV